MSWLFGASVGFLRGGPLGAIIGGAIQHFVTQKLENNIRCNLPGVKDHPVFVVSVTAIMTKLSMMKGLMTGEEIGAIHGFFIKHLDYAGDDLQHINEVIRETRRVDPDLRSLVDQYKNACQYNLLLLALGYQIALIGGAIDAVQGGINDLARFLGVSPEEHDKVRDKYSLGAIKTPYSVLGVKATASDEEIKKAYRRLVGRYHPDRVTYLGDEVLEDAHIRFLEIQAAYGELGAKRKTDCGSLK